jgi:hypothetical protein
MTDEEDGQVEPADAPVARLHLRSTVQGVDHVAIEDWCIGDGGDGWAGVGWGLWKDESYTSITWEQYVEMRDEHGDGVDESVRRLHDLPTGTLVWSRRRDSSYWLGEITGPWCYRDGDEAHALDMFNLRPCRWWHVGTQDLVPGKVVNNFSARKTLNPVADRGAVRYTRRLHAQYAGHAFDLTPTTPTEVITSLLGPTDLEDLVAAYLQDQHELVLVNRGSSTVGYEYVLRDRATGRRAVATVKSGGTPVNLSALPTDPAVDVWAYTVIDRNWTGQNRDDIRWITTEELAAFVSGRAQVLPEQVIRWLG